MLVCVPAGPMIVSGSAMKLAMERRPRSLAAVPADTTYHRTLATIPVRSTHHS